jgi:hypothetical protein
MFRGRWQFRRSGLVVLTVVCLAGLTATSVFAGGVASPLRATDVLGSPDAAVNGKFAVGSSSVGSKALTVTGVIDFLGAGTVHNYFTQGGGNNMQINTNVDEANTVGDATRSQWKLVLGSNLDQFSIRRSPAGGTYNEDALFFIDGATGDVGIATVDTGNGATIPFTPQARLDVRTASGDAIYGISTATTGYTHGVYGESYSTSGFGVYGVDYATTGFNIGVYGLTQAGDGIGVVGFAPATAGGARGVLGESDTPDGIGVDGRAAASTGTAYGVFGMSYSTDGTGVYGYAYATTGTNYGVVGMTKSTNGKGVYYVGGLAGTGTKSAIVDTQDYGWRTLYAMESPQNWFEDFGQASLVDGQAVVRIEPIFAQTVNLAADYHVFLTPRGAGCTLYVIDQSKTSFTVKANEGSGCQIAFDYRIIAPRRDYEGLRLEPAEDPAAVVASLKAFPAPGSSPSP